METSDSENFESADEEIEIETWSKVKHIETSCKRELIKQPEEPLIVSNENVEFCKTEKNKEKDVKEETLANVEDISVNLTEKLRTSNQPSVHLDDVSRTDFKDNKHETLVLDKDSNVTERRIKSELEHEFSHSDNREENMWEVDDEEWNEISDKIDQHQRHKHDDSEEETWSNKWKESEEECKDLPKERSHKLSSQSKFNRSKELDVEHKGEEEESTWDEWDQWDQSNLNQSTPGNTGSTASAVVAESSPNRTETSNSGSVWGGWGNWGVTSLISTATSSVSTLTNQVTHGLAAVLESGIGIPEPEELAKLHEDSRQKSSSSAILEKENEKEDDTVVTVAGVKSFNFENLLTGVTQITKLVETTGNKVITGGLDTLETIGKKTMEVLQEGDPGLKKKYSFLKMDHDKPNLSQILREAKEKSQEETTRKDFTSKKVNYETLFDDHQGLVHLEALEMLSKQCNIKLGTFFESISGNMLTEMQETMAQITELCDLPESEENEDYLSLEEMKEKINEYVSEMNVSISYEKLILVWVETESWLKNVDNDKDNCKVLHEKAIDTLAQLTALAVEQFHKGGELLLIKERRSTADEADSLVQITLILTNFMGFVASQFCSKMGELNIGKENIDNRELNDLITNIYFEAANSSSYIRDAFKLLIPIVQVGAM